jgi:peroxidase
MAALVQHITYDEFLPVLLGKEQTAQFGLRLEQVTHLKFCPICQLNNKLLQGHSNSYKPGLNPTVPASFGTAAFRFGHSLLPSTIERWSHSHRYIS